MADEPSKPSSSKGSYLQRLHQLPPAPDPNATVLNQIKFYLDRYKIKEASSIFYDETNQDALHQESDYMWELIPHICNRLRGLSQFRFRVFEGCEKMLYRIATDDRCNPKEILIILLSELSRDDENNEDDNVFKATIRSLEGTLFRMEYPTPRDGNLNWVLTVLMKYIQDLELPFETQGTEERIKVMNDSQAKRFIEVLPLMLSFIEDFENFNKPLSQFNRSPMPVLTESQVDEVLNKELSELDIINEQESDNISHCLIQSLTKLIDNPIAHLDCRSSCPEFHAIALRNIRILLKLKPNLFSSIYTDSNKELGEPACLSLATSAYLYWCEFDNDVNSVQYYPQILDQEYLLICHFIPVSQLLERQETLVHEKGLLLMQSLLQNVHCLTEKFIESPRSEQIQQQLFKIMVFSPLKSNRKLAVDIFTKICDLLLYRLKFKFLKSIVESADVKNTVLGLCIDLYRKNLSKVQCRDQFEAVGTLEFIDLCFKVCLDESQHIDIIEKDDLILSTLALLRFAKLRKLVNEELTAKVKDSFFEPIRTAISLVSKDLLTLQTELESGTKHLSKKRPKQDALQQFLSKNMSEDEAQIFAHQLFSPSSLDCQPAVDVTEMKEEEYLSWALCRVSLIESILSTTSDVYGV